MTKKQLIINSTILACQTMVEYSYKISDLKNLLKNPIKIIVYPDTYATKTSGPDKSYWFAWLKVPSHIKFNHHTRKILDKNIDDYIRKNAKHIEDSPENIRKNMERAYGSNIMIGTALKLNLKTTPEEAQQIADLAMEIIKSVNDTFLDN